MKTDYKQFTDTQLEEKIKEIKLMHLATFRMIEGKEAKAGNRKKLRRELARIETEKSRRRNSQLIERRSR